MKADASKRAEIYRMVMPDHICPYGLKSLALLKRKGFEVDDHWLRSREDTDDFKVKHDVKTTPQTFIDGERIGGHDDLRSYFGKSVRGADDVSYQPVIAVFAVALSMALASSWAMDQSLVTLRAAEWFIAFSMCILALLKLQDVESFSSMFLNYDLLARKFVPYAYLYPFGELIAGVLMVAGAMMWVSIPIALFIGSIGAVSVFKVVYLDKRELKCACVGGNSRVPLGFVSLTENLMMIAMAVWMLLKHWT